MKFEDKCKAILEENNLELTDELIDELKKLKVNNKYKVDYERQTGSVYFDIPEKKYIVYFTPYWEGSKNIEVQVYDNDNTEVYSKSIKFKTVNDDKKDAKEIVKSVENDLKKSKLI